jgi:hypothetical protein
LARRGWLRSICAAWSKGRCWKKEVVDGDEREEKGGNGIGHSLVHSPNVCAGPKRGKSPAYGAYALIVRLANPRRDWFSGKPVPDRLLLIQPGFQLL